MRLFLLFVLALPLAAQAPGTRVLLDAHNCYPYDGKFADRIERALGTGLPLALEPDLVWAVDSTTQKGRSVVSHGPPLTGAEPTLESYFLERIRPLVEAELKSGDRRRWPVVTLNVDFKDTKAAHIAEFWNTLGKYEAWLTTARRTATPERPEPLRVGPVLVLVGVSDDLEAVLHTVVPVGGTLRAFGATVPTSAAGRVSPQTAATATLQFPAATNYRRWVNFPWAVVEQGGQRQAGDWIEADAGRLRSLVDGAHKSGLWIRFYTLNGHAAEAGQGWSEGYNFGSLDAARVRWRAARQAGVDFIATDQYEDLAATLRQP